MTLIPVFFAHFFRKGFVKGGGEYCLKGSAVKILFSYTHPPFFLSNQRAGKELMQIGQFNEARILDGYDKFYVQASAEAAK